MAKYWSESTSSFYDSNVCAVSQMPSDAAQITDTEYKNLMELQAAGYKIVHNTSTGEPEAIAQSLTEATATVHEVTNATSAVSGHVKLSDATDSTSASGAGVAATPAAVKAVADAKAPKDHSSTATTYGVGNGTKYGHLKLSDATDGTSGVSGGTAATPAAVKAVADAKAPKDHSSTATTYGIGTGSNYGHVKLSDSTSSTSAATAGIAASPKSVSDALTAAKAYTDDVDDTVVHLAGNEVITGTKRFESTVFAQHSIDNVKTVPSVNQYQTALVLRDNQGQAFGHIQTASYADTESVLVKLSIVDGIRNGQTDDGTLVTHAIGIGMDKDGNHFTHAPTPSAGDDSNQIATTKWVNDAIATKAEDSAVVHKTGTETITGAKTFSAATTFGNTVNLNASVQGGADRDIWIAHATGGTKHRTVLLAGNAYADGASLYLHAKDQTNKGRFDLVAHDGTNSKILCGKPDETLTWAGKNVVRSVNGTNADAAGDVRIVTAFVASREGYIEYAYGMVLQWGVMDGSVSSKVSIITKKIPCQTLFAVPYDISGGHLNGAGGIPASWRIDLTTTTTESFDVTGTSGTMGYIILGYVS